MEKVKILVLFGFMSLHTLAQESIVKEGLLRTQLTLSPSKMLNDNLSYFYLHGNLEGYVSDKISISGEGYLFLGRTSFYADIQSFKHNHSVFFGANYHFIKNNHDVYLGIQPGVAYTQVKMLRGMNEQYTSTNPLFSSVVGYNYYINNIFHFFVQTRLILGKHLANDAKSLNEIRFSAGLGFNLNTK